MSKPTDSLIRLPDVLEQTGFTKSDLYRKIRENEFPEPIRRGRTSLWSQNEVNEYIERLKKESRGVSVPNVKNRHLLEQENAA